MVTLRHMSDLDRLSVLGLEVTSAQRDFVEPLAETLSPDAPLRDHFVIAASGTIVGFFQIDSASGGQAIAGDLELHEVAIDAAHQGQGYGRAFVLALKPFLMATYPGRGAVCLTVNCRNVSAYRLYELGGFEDTGRLRTEGRSGPQHIMRMKLR